MNKQDILKKRAEYMAWSVDTIRSNKIDISDRETPEQFVARGGKINHIAQGITSEHPNADLPIGAQNDYRAVHDKNAKARINASKNGGRGIDLAKKAISDPCPKCGGEVIYISSRQCVACQRAKNKRLKVS